MKTCFALSLTLVGSGILSSAQGTAPQTSSGGGPPVYQAATAPAAVPQVYIYEQKFYNSQAAPGGRTYLIAPEQAQSIINRFKEQYQKQGNPRVLIYVNRDLIDESSGMKLTSHKRVVEAKKDPTAAGIPVVTQERVVSTNIYRVRNRPEMSLADKQTMRDVERLFGRPLRMAGVQLVDQQVANQVTGGMPAADSFTVVPESDQARRDRENLTKLADVVLEVLISSKETVVPEPNGNVTYTAPDIQATAVRLSDSRILGQATAADLIGQGPAAGKAMSTLGIREIAEATALSLMEDMMLTP